MMAPRRATHATAMSESPASLRALAHKCRCLAAGGGMDNVAAALNEIAHDYDRQADRIEKAEARARERLAARGPAQRRLTGRRLLSPLSPRSSLGAMLSAHPLLR